MEYTICPFSNKCKLFNNKLFDNNSEEIYKAIYCLTKKHKECKRYEVIKITGECSDFIMPNSKYDLKTLIQQQEEEKRLFEKLNIDLT